MARRKGMTSRALNLFLNGHGPAYKGGDAGGMLRLEEHGTSKVS